MPTVLKRGQVRGDLLDLRIRLHEIESKANDIIKELDPFSFQRFESRLFRPREHENNAILYLQREVEKAKQEERISSMKMAESSL